jgi:hypothetical protein
MCTGDNERMRKEVQAKSCEVHKMKEELLQKETRIEV